MCRNVLLSDRSITNYVGLTKSNFGSVVDAVMTPLWDHQSVVDVLGGEVAVGRLTGNLSGRGAAANWVRRRRFPAEHYFIMREALADIGFFAPMELWCFTTVTSVQRRAA
jgi:hypothetical protein